MQRKARLTAGMVATAAAVAFAYAELQKYDVHSYSPFFAISPPRLRYMVIIFRIVLSMCRPAPAPEADAALREALLSAPDGVTDAESGGDRKRKRNRSWLSLVGTAARYMWPTGLGLQIRAVVCVLLIVILRLLNLAVPIAYKHVIDEFSKLTEQSHPSGDEPPVTVPFAQAFFPWVCAWLVLYFLQGGGGGGMASGLLSNIRSYLWIPIGQNSFR